MYKILIVDDEPDVVSLLKDYFELGGYETYTACDGEEALERIRIKPDLILLDVNMPRMDGLSVCQRIRDHVSCPILFLTAKVEDSDKIRGFAAGGDDYIVKPFSIDELGARVAAHLRREHRNTSEGSICFWGRLVLEYSAKSASVEG
ncbi:MAG: response regulator transcription factor, partial [Acetatifactor sp.]|nr:response regulator transcription factor [Acetatifactor sp.]